MKYSRCCEGGVGRNVIPSASSRPEAVPVRCAGGELQGRDCAGLPDGLHHPGVPRRVPPANARDAPRRLPTTAGALLRSSTLHAGTGLSKVDLICSRKPVRFQRLFPVTQISQKASPNQKP